MPLADNLYRRYAVSGGSAQGADMNRPMVARCSCGATYPIPQRGPNFTVRCQCGRTLANVRSVEGRERYYAEETAQMRRMLAGNQESRRQA